MSEENICPITGEQIVEEKRLPCFHKFEKEAIENWLLNHTTCPICRHDTNNNGGFNEVSKHSQNTQNTQNTQNIRTDAQANIDGSIRRMMQEMLCSFGFGRYQQSEYIMEKYIRGDLSEQFLYKVFTGFARENGDSIDNMGCLTLEQEIIIKKKLMDVMRRIHMDEIRIFGFEDEWKNLKTLILQAGKNYHDNILMCCGGLNSIREGNAVNVRELPSLGRELPSLGREFRRAKY